MSAQRSALLAAAVVPPAVLVLMQELQTADLIRICEFGCASPASALLFFSLAWYVVLTPALIVAYLAVAKNPLETWRAVGLIAMFFLPYVLIFGRVAFLGSPDPFLSALLSVFPVPLMLALGYLVVRASPAGLAAVILLPILPAFLLAPTAFPNVINGNTSSCTTTGIVNASSPFMTTQQATYCSSVTIPVPSVNFADYYLFFLLLASVAWTIYVVLRGSRPAASQPTLASGLSVPLPISGCPLLLVQVPSFSQRPSYIWHR